MNTPRNVGHSVVDNIVAVAERYESPTRYLSELRAVGLLDESEYRQALDRLAA